MKDSAIPFVGGAEVQQTVQMRALQRSGYSISVLVNDYGQPDQVDCEGIKIYKIPKSGSRGFPGTRFFYPRMSDVVGLLRRLSPDIVFIQTAGEQVASAAAYAKLFGKRFVFAGASDPDFQLGPLPGMPPQHTFMYRQGLKSADAIVVQNVGQLEMLKRNFSRDGHLIQNGYEEPAALPGQFAGHILWAATVKPLKRPDLYIELARRTPDRQFVMVGGPGVTPDAKSYFDSIADLARGVANLKMTGHVPYDDVGRYFDAAALSINTSDYEGLPNTFMQAWLRGIPTVSFVRPESAPGQSGTLSCANIDEMVAVCHGLTHDASQWEQASRNCSAYFQRHHTIDEAVRRYDAVFRKVLAP